ncbi:hypothetical protein [Prosthecobacter sp.]
MRAAPVSMRGAIIGPSGCGKTTLLQMPGALASLSGRLDEIVIYEVMSQLPDDPWWDGHQEVLEACFRHEEVIIRALPLMSMLRTCVRQKTTLSYNQRAGGTRNHRC